LTSVLPLLTPYHHHIYQPRVVASCQGPVLTRYAPLSQCRNSALRRYAGRAPSPSLKERPAVDSRPRQWLGHLIIALKSNTRLGRRIICHRGRHVPVIATTNFSVSTKHYQWRDSNTSRRVRLLPTVEAFESPLAFSGEGVSLQMRVALAPCAWQSFSGHSFTELHRSALV
jgi:hypothetical protein